MKNKVSNYEIKLAILYCKETIRETSSEEFRTKHMKLLKMLKELQVRKIKDRGGKSETI